MQVKSIAECSMGILTSIKLQFSIKTLVLSIFKWLFKTDFTVTVLFYIQFGFGFWQIVWFNKGLHSDSLALNGAVPLNPLYTGEFFHMV